MKKIEMNLSMAGSTNSRSENLSNDIVYVMNMRARTIAKISGYSIVNGFNADEFGLLYESALDPSIKKSRLSRRKKKKKILFWLPVLMVTELKFLL